LLACFIAFEAPPDLRLPSCCPAPPRGIERTLLLVLQLICERTGEANAIDTMLAKRMRGNRRISENRSVGLVFSLVGWCVEQVRSWTGMKQFAKASKTVIQLFSLDPVFNFNTSEKPGKPLACLVRYIVPVPVNVQYGSRHCTVHDRPPQQSTINNPSCCRR
jgi:hypothetical protein